jgi:DNA-binding LytR/AlgR family response regulator
MQLAVTRNVDGTSGIINLPINDVIFMEYDMIVKGVFVNTLNDKLYIAGTLTYWTDALKAQGYHFEKVDRNYVVQIPTIKKLDKIFTKAYFEYETTPLSKSVTLSQRQFKEVVTQIKVFNPQIVVV